MTAITRLDGTSPFHESRRKRTRTCALQRQAAGTLPAVRTLIIILGIALLLAAAADLTLMLDVLI